MQDTRSHPYQTRSMTAGSQGTETRNRGGPASSSQSDWAVLPEEVCQRILLTDLQTFRRGANVCRSWWNHGQAALRPNPIWVNCLWSPDFSAEHFWLVDDCADDLLDSLIDKIGTCAYTSLSSLTIVATSAFAPEDGMKRINKVVPLRGPCLSRLSISFGSFSDWSILEDLPGTLQELDFSILAAEPHMPNGPLSGNLSLTLPHLQKCTLGFATADYDPLSISTVFDLPCLGHMVLENGGSCSVYDQSAKFCEWELEDLPDTCTVVCDLNMTFSSNEMSQHVWTIIELDDYHDFVMNAPMQLAVLS